MSTLIFTPAELDEMRAIVTASGAEAKANPAVMAIAAFVADTESISVTDAAAKINTVVETEGLPLQPGQTVRDSYFNLATRMGVSLSQLDIDEARQDLENAGIPTLPAGPESEENMKSEGPQSPNAHA